MIRVAKHLLRNDQPPIRSSDIVVSRVTDGQQCQTVRVTAGHRGVRRNVGCTVCFEKWIFQKSGYFEKLDISKKWIFKKVDISKKWIFEEMDILIKY